MRAGKSASDLTRDSVAGMGQLKTPAAFANLFGVPRMIKSFLQTALVVVVTIVVINIVKPMLPTSIQAYL